MIRKISILFLLLALFAGKAEALTLSTSSEVSVITCSPGADIYALYGHSAIRVKDPEQGLDFVFNYGVFSFETPHFIYRFCKGQTDYMLAVCDFSSFMTEYQIDHRSVYEQVLNLNYPEKQRLFSALVENYRPENRFYRYNFFFNNCSTKVRDIIVGNVNGRVEFIPKSLEPKTFRQILHLYMGGSRWTELGINLIVGAPADKAATASQEDFIPEFVMNHLATANINDGTMIRPMVKETRVLYQAPVRAPFVTSLLDPFIVFLILFLTVLYLSVLEYQGKKKFEWLDPIVYGLIGAASMIILWITCFSEHPAVRPNLNLIWAFPLDILFPICWFVKRIRPQLEWYHLFISVLLVVFILFSYFLPQSFDSVVYLLSLMLLSRSLLHVIKHFTRK